MFISKREKTKAAARRRVEKPAIFRERFFPKKRDEGVRIGLILSSNPEAKKSSKT